MGAAQSAATKSPRVSESPWKPRVLVLGASGLLGRPLVQELVARGFAVSALTSTPWEKKHPRVQALFTALGVESSTLDLDKDAQLGGQALRHFIVCNGFDLVINLAADRGGVKFDETKNKMNNPSLNTRLPANLADIASELGVPVFLISTEYVWSGRDNTEEGYPPVAVGTDDRFMQDAGAPYAVQKYQAEVEAERKRVSLPTGDSITIIRIPLLFGELITALEDGTATSSIANYLSDNTWKHDTWQRRYPTDAADAAFIIAALARKRLTSGLEHHVYNYGCQTRTSKYEFLVAFALGAGLPVEDVHPQNCGELSDGKRPPFDVKLDIRQTRKELLSVGDWREPTCLDAPRILDIYHQWFQADILQRFTAVQATRAKEGDFNLLFLGSNTMPSTLNRRSQRANSACGTASMALRHLTPARAKHICTL